MKSLKHKNCPECKERVQPKFAFCLCSRLACVGDRCNANSIVRKYVCKSCDWKSSITKDFEIYLSKYRRFNLKRQFI